MWEPQGEKEQGLEERLLNLNGGKALQDCFGLHINAKVAEQHGNTPTPHPPVQQSLHTELPHTVVKILHTFYTGVAVEKSNLKTRTADYHGERLLFGGYFLGAIFCS